MKTCLKCKKIKNEDDFNKNVRRIDGFENHCKECRKACREANKEVTNQKKREIYLQNKEILLLRSKKWRELNREKYKEGRKQYRERNKDKIKEQNKKWYNLNKSNVLESGRIKYASMSESEKNILRSRCISYSKSPAKYDRWANKLAIVERIDCSDDGFLFVPCTYCGRWFMPTNTQVERRFNAIGRDDPRSGESRLYCSDPCKRSCSIYGQILYPKGFKEATSREVQPELRQMVFARDDWTCQICGKQSGSLHCHHITGVKVNPIESADVDNCITLCKKHHEWVHTKAGCRYFDLQCNEPKAMTGT
jgi:hypothetical protein